MNSSLTSPTAAVESRHRDVTATYNAAFVVLSCFVSFIGCMTTFELLERRTSRYGMYNWYLLIASCISMGSVGIWSMHFIGNRAILLRLGQIVYNPNFTVVSFLLPIVVIFPAFFVVGAAERPRAWHVWIAGTLVGFAVCSMHYVGQLGISNYHCTYKQGFLAGAVIIAIAASIVALWVFFSWRARWINNWWKRALCAASLAFAVSGMHWTAALGTSYTFVMRTEFSRRRLSSGNTAIICAILSCLACLVLFVLASIAQRQRIRAASKVKQLVLACAFYDVSGRIMVTSQGLLPSKKITNHYIERDFAADEFSKTHPAFIWIFRASRNWRVVSDVIPGMRDHLSTDPIARKFCPDQPDHPNALDHGLHQDLDFGLIFKELFCVAAEDLAEQIRQPLSQMGSLYDEMLATGTHQSQTSRTIVTRGSMGGDLELGRTPASSPTPSFGRGQVLFVVQQLSKTETVKFTSRGYRFAVPAHISDSLANTLQVSSSELLERLERMRGDTLDERLLEPGVHLAWFALRANVQRYFDVLVSSNAQNQLPTFCIQKDILTKPQIEMLTRADEMSVAEVLRWLDPQHDPFYRRLFRAIQAAAEQMDDHTKSRAIFSAKRIEAPCRPAAKGLSFGTCTLLSIRFIMDISALPPDKSLAWVPLRFFQAQQQSYTGTANHETFAHQIHREFARSTSKEIRRRLTASSIGALSDGPASPPVSPQALDGMINPFPTSLSSSMPDTYSRTKPPQSSSQTRRIQPRRPSFLRATLLGSPTNVAENTVEIAAINNRNMNQEVISGDPDRRSSCNVTYTKIPAFGGIRVSNHVSIDVSEKTDEDMAEVRRGDLPSHLFGTTPAAHDLELDNIVGDFCAYLPPPRSRLPSIVGSSSIDGGIRRARGGSIDHGAAITVRNIGDGPALSHTISTFVPPGEVAAEASEFGTMGGATAATVEPRTFVDELCELARLPPRA